MTVAGFTGHQRIGSAADARWVRKQIESAVLENNVRLGITSLAIGADQLFASVLAEQRIAFTAIIPCRTYEETFDRPGLRKYRQLLQMAAEKSVLDFNRPSETAYYEAGKVIVDRANFVIAVWNGKPAKGLGGTADIVAYARRKRREIVHINPLSRQVETLQ